MSTLKYLRYAAAMPKLKVNSSELALIMPLIVWLICFFIVGIVGLIAIIWT